MGGCSENFGIFYLKYMCQYYSMTAQWGHENIFICSRGGAQQFSVCLGGRVIFYHHRTFKPAPCPTVFVDNPLRDASYMTYYTKLVEIYIMSGGQAPKLPFEIIVHNQFCAKIFVGGFCSSTIKITIY